jgi:hypothetical protein
MVTKGHRGRIINRENGCMAALVRRRAGASPYLERTGFSRRLQLLLSMMAEYVNSL